MSKNVYFCREVNFCRLLKFDNCEKVKLDNPDVLT